MTRREQFDAIIDGSGTEHTGQLADLSDVSGGYSVVSKTTNYAASDGEVVLADASGGAFSVTLPAADSGSKVAVKKTDSSSNAVTVATPGSETIDGMSSFAIGSENEVIEVISDGSHWYLHTTDRSPEFYDESGEELTADVNNTKTSTDELSSIPIIDPNTSDWGADVTDILNNSGPGATIVTPPGDYRTSTKVDIPVDFPVSFFTPAQNRGRSNNHGAIIHPDHAGPLIESQSAIHVTGLMADASDASGSDGIITHEPISGGVAGRGLPGDVLKVMQSEADDNSNVCNVTVSGFNCGGSPLYVENATADPPNVNGNIFRVPYSYQNGGYAANIRDGFGNTIHIGTIEGSNHTGVAYAGGSDTAWTVSHIEPNLPLGFDFQGYNNGVVVNYTGLDTATMANYGNVNNIIMYPFQASMPFIQRGDGWWQVKVDGTDMATTTAGKGFVVTTPDGTGHYRIRVDNTGALVTESVNIH